VSLPGVFSFICIAQIYPRYSFTAGASGDGYSKRSRVDPKRFLYISTCTYLIVGRGINDFQKDEHKSQKNVQCERVSIVKDSLDIVMCQSADVRGEGK